MPPENWINKKKFTNGISSDQNPDLKKLFFHLYAHKIISMMKIHSVKPSEGSIFCGAPTQIQGGVMEGQSATASLSELKFRMKELFPQICARKLPLLFPVLLPLSSLQKEWQFEFSRSLMMKYPYALLGFTVKNSLARSEIKLKQIVWQQKSMYDGKDDYLSSSLSSIQLFKIVIFWVKIEISPPRQIYFCFVDYAKASDCADHNKLWKILKEVGIPDHLTCLLRKLYAGQEATVRTVDQQTAFK